MLIQCSIGHFPNPFGLTTATIRRRLGFKTPRPGNSNHQPANTKIRFVDALKTEIAGRKGPLGRTL